MDSITQIVLGAAVAEIAVGKKIGRKASLYGAVLGTIPDLDVLWVKNAVDSFTEHRSFTHSLLVMILASPIFALLLRRWHRYSRLDSKVDSRVGLVNDKAPISLLYWSITVYLIFATHALIDWFTIYGTQLFWPLTKQPYGVGSVFIVDPIYTFSLAIPLLITIIKRNRLVVHGMCISCAYLAWSFYAQSWQDQRMSDALIANNIKAKKTVTIATPLNTLLWKQIALVDGGYWLSYSSVFDSPDSVVQSRFFADDNKELKRLAAGDTRNSEQVEKLQFFTKDFYTVKEKANDLLLSDMRMGSFNYFVFTFKVAERKANSQDFVLVEASKVNSRPDRAKSMEGLRRIKQRVFDESVNLFALY